MEKKFCFGCMRWKERWPVCEHCGFDDRQRNEIHQLPMGSVLKGQYIVGRVLGQGGFGITYMGLDRYLNLPVAIKEYYPTGLVMRDCSHSICVTNCEGQTGSSYESNLKRFLREAQSLAKLSSVPEVVHVRNYFPENGTAYIIMEYIQGVTLKDYIRSNGVLSAAQAAAVFRPVMAGLQKVHEVGLVHRDISPDNIMLLPNGDVKLLDFGAVRDYANQELSQSTQAILKPGFAPVEQYRAMSELGPYTDLYALCATMYYCMTGKLPPEAPERMMEGAEFRWEMISGLSANQLNALKKGTAILAQDRYRSVAEFEAAFFSTAPVKAEKKGGKGKILALAAVAVAAVAAGALLLMPKDTEAIPTEPRLAVTEPEATEAATEPAPTVPEDPMPILVTPEGGKHHEDFPCWMVKTADGVTVTGPGLYIETHGRHVIARVEALPMEESYTVNLRTTERFRTEYRWSLTMNGMFEELQIQSQHSARTPGQENQISFQEMEHALYLSPGDQLFSWYDGISGEQVRVGDDSITWEFDITEEPNYENMVAEFDPEGFYGFQLWVDDPSRDLEVIRTYTLEEGEPRETITGQAPNSGYHAENRSLSVTSEPGSVLLEGEDVEIWLQEGGMLTVTMHNVSTDPIYRYNIPESGDYFCENRWSVDMVSGENAFGASVLSITYPDSEETQISIEDMEVNAGSEHYGYFKEHTGSSYGDGTLTLRLQLHSWEELMQWLPKVERLEVISQVTEPYLWISRTYVP